jgi:hypothetical protein
MPTLNSNGDLCANNHGGFRREIIVDANQRLLIEAGAYHGYLIAISKNMLSGLPLVIGPLDLRRDQWRALSEHCRIVAKLLQGRKYKFSPSDKHPEEIY